MDILGKCPLCGKDFVENKFGWGCSAWKDGCKASIYSEIAGRKISRDEAKALLENGSIGPLNGFKSKQGKPFSAKLVLDDAGKPKFEFENNAETTNIKCPKCGKMLSKDAVAYRCDCGLKIYKKMAQNELQESEIRKLCEVGHTDRIDGFISKKGKEFSAYVVLGDNGTEFSFDEPEDQTPTPAYDPGDGEDDGYGTDYSTDDFSDDDEEYPF